MRRVQRRKLAAFPCHLHSIAVSQWIADFIIRYTLPVVRRHPVFPAAFRIPVFDRACGIRIGLRSWRRRRGRRRRRGWSRRRRWRRCRMQRNADVFRGNIPRVSVVPHLIPAWIGHTQHCHALSKRNGNHDPIACPWTRTHIQAGCCRNHACADAICRRPRKLHIIGKHIPCLSAVLHFIPASGSIKHRNDFSERNRYDNAVSRSGAGTHIQAICCNNLSGKRCRSCTDRWCFGLCLLLLYRLRGLLLHFCHSACISRCLVAREHFLVRGLFRTAAVIRLHQRHGRCAIRAARHKGIPLFNLYDVAARICVRTCCIGIRTALPDQLVVIVVFVQENSLVILSVGRVAVAHALFDPGNIAVVVSRVALRNIADKLPSNKETPIVVITAARRRIARIGRHDRIRRIQRLLPHAVQRVPRICYVDARGGSILRRQIIFAIQVSLPDRGTIRFIDDSGNIVQLIIAVLRRIQPLIALIGGLPDKTPCAVIVIIIEQIIFDVNVLLGFARRAVFPRVPLYSIIALRYKLACRIVSISNRKAVAIRHTLQRTVIRAISVRAQQIIPCFCLRPIAECIVSKGVFKAIVFYGRKQICTVVIAVIDRYTAACDADQPVVRIIRVGSSNAVCIRRRFQKASLQIVVVLRAGSSERVNFTFNVSTGRYTVGRFRIGCFRLNLHRVGWVRNTQRRRISIRRIRIGILDIVLRRRARHVMLGIIGVFERISFCIGF